jgi:hypothetical protein
VKWALYFLVLNAIEEKLAMAFYSLLEMTLAARMSDSTGEDYMLQ